MLQVNADFLINQRQNKIFSHKTPYTSTSFPKTFCALYCRFFQKYPLFTTFLLVFTGNEVCNISNKNQTPSNLAKYQYFCTRDFISLLHSKIKLTLSIAQVFRNIHFLPYDNQFSQCVKCVIFQINTNLLVIYQNIIISTQRLLLHFEEMLALSIATVFWNIQFLPHLPLLLRVSQVCTISNK